MKAEYARTVNTITRLASEKGRPFLQGLGVYFARQGVILDVRSATIDHGVMFIETWIDGPDGSRHDLATYMIPIDEIVGFQAQLDPPAMDEAKLKGLRELLKYLEARA
jgi:hypothetical protein